MQSILELHLDEIGNLIETPEMMREIAIQHLTKIRDANPPQLNPLGKQKIGNAILLLESIANSSIKKAYQIIFNQLCVLSVSALSADLENDFIRLVDEHRENIQIDETNFKLTFKELAEANFQIDSVGELLVRKESSIDFQDLQSIVRSYKNFCGRDIVLPEGVKNSVIFYQQCRHVLLHKNGEVDANFVKRTGKANLRNYRVGSKIRLEESDWQRIKSDFATCYDIIINPPPISPDDIPF